MQRSASLPQLQPAGAPWERAQAALALLGQRLADPVTRQSLLWYVFWAQVRQANLWFLAVAFVLWYGAFFVRGWRWGRMLDSAGFNQANGFPIPPTRGLAEIIVLARGAPPRRPHAVDGVLCPCKDRRKE
jgi:hypothetical protein